MATYCPGLILIDRLSITFGILSLYLKETLLSSMPPETLSTTLLPSAISGSASKTGFAISSTGLMPATVIVMDARDINAPETIP